MIAQVDVAYLDATFFDQGELPGRDMSTIPHPMIVHSMERFSSLPDPERKKIHFIHLNHSNPALWADSEASHEVSRRGFRIAVEGEIEEL
jgi:pyrroloquinoline quinone biosynthesis protein B